jgi:hypothetical protein
LPISVGGKDKNEEVYLRLDGMIQRKSPFIVEKGVYWKNWPARCKYAISMLGYSSDEGLNSEPIEVIEQPLQILLIRNREKKSVP